MSNLVAREFILLNYPINHLDDDEISNPFLVIQDFFSFAHLPEIRDILWASLKANVTGSYPETLNLKERNDIVYLYEYVLKLVEAAHLLNEKRKSESSI